MIFDEIQGSTFSLTEKRNQRGRAGEDALADLRIKKNRWQNWVIGFAFWTIIGLSFASRPLLLSYLEDWEKVPWQWILSSYLIDFYLWGAASFFIFRLSQRFPIEREHIAGRLMLHLSFSFVFSFVVLAVSILAMWFLGYSNKTEFSTLNNFFRETIFHPYLLHQGLLIYWGTLMASHAFEYYRQLQEGRLRTAELASQLSQAQFSALKMQIHPHFLFNTLNSIAALLHKDVEAADRMIARLSDFFRLTLKSSNEPAVTLGEELEFLRNYLEIEKIRFQDSLQVKIEIEPDVLEAQVPNLILQPLVENAIRHGVAKRTSAGLLKIQARHERDRLLIEIDDNGPGLKSKDGTKVNYGVGLENTRARLDRSYDGDFYFDIAEKQDDEGTIVKIDIPFVTGRGCSFG
jgi:two-component system, LytTR family, sensor kinase